MMLAHGGWQVARAIDVSIGRQSDSPGTIKIEGAQGPATVPFVDECAGCCVILQDGVCAITGHKQVTVGFEDDSPSARESAVVCGADKFAYKCSCGAVIFQDFDAAAGDEKIAVGPEEQSKGGD